MTFKEKLQKEHPEKVSVDYIGGCCGCPRDFDYSTDSYQNCGHIPNNTVCTACWNKQIPLPPMVEEWLDESVPMKEFQDELKKLEDDDSEQVLVLLTKSQCESLADFIEFELMDTIRKDKEIDNIEWLCDMTTAYQTLKEATK